ncbi:MULTISPECIES: hypothetical protein [Clostridium]|uniref:Uncharacterized protein n=1 Tax=Clostridium beijerinckii TaxID=1520 RepID=A0A1S9N876_CLOBE|nr:MULTISPECIES: hypothetical protein [Clostridium]MBA8935209.1 hypothetical protein [Clostridium beijerinckii]MBN7574860.1 hypothetical protein [Clostridium beijerinckii]MBN7579753.1 hypothetical protein [Clostridium beijerinckii]MBN7584624.1 hypothetical protein [Clostridium beijerinckii]MBO0520486.1 hypothetical protein [Clostridium beijerinckii]
MNQNVDIILEIIKNMPCENIEEVDIPRSLGYEQIGMNIDEFDEAIKYIQDNGLLRKIVPIFKDNKIVLINIM